MKILFLTTVLPGKKRMGSEAASQAVIDALLELGNDVTVVGYVRSDDDYRLASGEVSAGRRPIESKDAGWRAISWFASSLVRGLPYSSAKYRSTDLVGVVRNAVRRTPFDAVIIDHVQMSWLIRAVPLRGTLIGMAHNIEHEMYRDFSGDRRGAVRRWVYRREAHLIEQMELDFARRVDQMWTLTRNDATFFARVATCGEVKELPLPAAAAPPETGAQEKYFDVGLIGSWSWQANEEGLRWFLDAVYPHLPGGLDIQVAGKGAEWLTGRFRNITYRGFVDDGQAFLRAARVVAIPTLSGGGIQIKTLDAIASGSRVVATPQALRGIDTPPPTVVVVHEAEEFAASLRAAVEHADPAAVTSMAARWSRERQARFRSELRRALDALAVPDAATLPSRNVLAAP